MTLGITWNKMKRKLFKQIFQGINSCLLLTLFVFGLHVQGANAQRLDRFGSVASGIYRNGRPAAIAFPQFIRYFSYSSFQKTENEQSSGDTAITFSL